MINGILRVSHARLDTNLIPLYYFQVNFAVCLTSAPPLIKGDFIVYKPVKSIYGLEQSLNMLI